MEKSTEQAGTVKPQAAPIYEDQSFHDFLKTFLGQLITIVNPESYEDAPVGHQIRAGFYKAKLIGLGNDYLILATQFVHSGKSHEKEPVRQYIPIANIKRVSLLKGERLLHI